MTLGLPAIEFQHVQQHGRVGVLDTPARQIRRLEALRMKGQDRQVPKTIEKKFKNGCQVVGMPDEVGEQIQRLKGSLDAEYIIFIM